MGTCSTLEQQTVHFKWMPFISYWPLHLLKAGQDAFSLWRRWHVSVESAGNVEGGLRSSHPGRSTRSSWEELHACQHGDEARGFIDKGSFSLCFLNLFFDLFSILGEGNSSPLQYLPGESHGWKSLAGSSPWGSKESDKTEQLTGGILGFSDGALCAAQHWVTSGWLPALQCLCFVSRQVSSLRDAVFLPPYNLPWPVASSGRCGSTVPRAPDLPNDCVRFLSGTHASPQPRLNSALEHCSRSFCLVSMTPWTAPWSTIPWMASWNVCSWSICLVSTTPWTAPRNACSRSFCLCRVLSRTAWKRVGVHSNWEMSLTEVFVFVFKILSLHIFRRSRQVALAQSPRYFLQLWFALSISWKQQPAKQTQPCCSRDSHRDTGLHSAGHVSIL